MTKQTLTLVSSNDGESALILARRNLAKRQQEWASANVDLHEAVEQQMRVERLIPDKQKISDRIQQLESEHVNLTEQWARKPEGASPKLPHAAEIDRLRKELRDADDVATVTKPALVRMAEQITGCQDRCSRAIDSIRDAANGVLVELAVELATELEQLEQRTALTRGHLVALQRHFELEGMRGRHVSNLSSVIAQMIPRGPYELAPQSVNQIVNKWAAFAGHLFDDNKAELELTQ